MTGEGEMIGIDFPMEEPFKTLVKQLNGRKWSYARKCLFVKNTSDNLKQIRDKFKGLAQIHADELFKNKNLNKKRSGVVHMIICYKRNRIFLQCSSEIRQEWKKESYAYSGAYYLQETGQWTIPKTDENYEQIRKYFLSHHCIVSSRHINRSYLTEKPVIKRWYDGMPVDENCMNEYRSMHIMKRLSPNTIKTYISMFRKFLAYFYGKNIKELKKEEIINYILWEINQNNISATVQNQLINAIKYYYEKVLGRPKEIYYLPRPKIRKSEPVVLNKKELQNILGGLNNIKHKCIMSLIFSGGLRREELLNLKVKDIDIERKIIFVRKGKGGKDRITILAETTMNYLKEYLKKYNPKYWLFEGLEGGRYSSVSVWKIFNRLKIKYGINKKGNVHLLRHTFATYLLESGTDIRYIQKLLGHSSVKTTQTYTHVANHELAKIKSPIDELEI